MPTEAELFLGNIVETANLECTGMHIHIICLSWNNYIESVQEYSIHKNVSILTRASCSKLLCIQLIKIYELILEQSEFENSNTAQNFINIRLKI